MALGLQLLRMVGEAGADMVVGVGRHLNKDVVSVRTAILPTPSSPTHFLLQTHNGACTLTEASCIHCHRCAPRLLPAPTPRRPCCAQWPEASMDVSGIKLHCLEGWVGFVPEDTDS